MKPMTPNETLERLRERDLRAILHISNMVGSVMVLDDILKVIVDTTAEAMDVQVCSIYLFNGEADALVLAASHGLNPAVVGKARFELGQGIPGWVAKHGRLLALKNGPADKRFSPIAGSEEDAYLAYLAAPLFIQTELIGVMTARKAGEYEFTDSETTLFKAICKQVAIVMEKKRLHNDKVDAERLAAIGLSLSEISHYIKNVLQSIKGGAYFVESGLNRGDLKRANQGWDTLKRANSRIGYLVENMLSYSRASALRVEEVSLEELVIEVLRQTEETARRRDILIDPMIEPDLPEIMVDYDSVHNALLNLVTNAMDAAEGEDARIIHIHLRRGAAEAGGRILLSVTDNGPGIASENMKRIFHLFFSTKGRHGSGIGLAVTKKVIEENGGTIEVESTPGQGANFTISFPAPELDDSEGS